MKITIIGSGPVGLVTGACLAEMGNEVICVEEDEKKIDALDKGRIPFYEPGLEELVRRNSRAKRLFFTTDFSQAVNRSLICFICNGNHGNQNGSMDLSSALTLAKQIGCHIEDYKVIVTKSTLPVGSAIKIQKVIEKELKDRGFELEFDVVSNPEFFKKGTAIDDFMKPERIIIGCDDIRVAELMKELYAPFVRTHNPIIVMDVISAELTKHATNAFLATKISFINEMANICTLTGADISLVRQGIGSDSRIGNLFLFPGLGYGGSSLPKDIKTLIQTAQIEGYRPRLLEAVEAINQDQSRFFVETIRGYFQNKLEGRVIGVWGLAFKPGTDDIQDAPAIKVISHLTKWGTIIKAFDPQALKAAQEFFGENPAINYAASCYEALEEVEALIINTEWKVFREPDFGQMKSLMKAPVIFDGRNLYNPSRMAKLNFKYFYIGQKNNL